MHSYSLERMAEQHRIPVIDIFNYYIANSFAAYLEEPVDYRFYDHFLEMSAGYPAEVILEGPGSVVGFAFLHPYRPGSTFRHTAQITYFILPDHTGKGAGSSLLERLSEGARSLGISILLANISSRNEASLNFHRKKGFQECGRFQRVGRKFELDFDVIWMQLDL